jgi:hypothetical protein
MKFLSYGGTPCEVKINSGEGTEAKLKWLDKNGGEAWMNIKGLLKDYIADAQQITKASDFEKHILISRVFYETV